MNIMKLFDQSSLKGGLPQGSDSDFTTNYPLPYIVYVATVASSRNLSHVRLSWTIDANHCAPMCLNKKPLPDTLS